MTIGLLVFKAALSLEKAGCLEPRHDARCLMEYCLGTDQKGLILQWQHLAGAELESAYEQLVELRSKRRPLQYIIGKWAFMGLEFFVGEGVLIPRQDTELLARTVISLLPEGGGKKVVYDLCAGTGCIGISVAHYAPEASVWLIEKFDEAFSYLSKNFSEHRLPNTALIKADIELGSEPLQLPEADILVCNPPYIKTGELSGLQEEVCAEPSLALDGGSDGLYYYRIIKEKWIKKLRPGASAVIEVADDMAEEAALVLCKDGQKTEILQDTAGKDRALLITF